MTTQGADPSYLFAREMDMWQAESARAQIQLDDLKQRGGDSISEQAWFDYCLRKRQELAAELDRVDNPQKYSAGDVGHVSLDDLDRQTE